MEHRHSYSWQALPKFWDTYFRLYLKNKFGWEAEPPGSGQLLWKQHTAPIELVALWQPCIWHPIPAAWLSVARVGMRVSGNPASLRLIPARWVYLWVLQPDCGQKYDRLRRPPNVAPLQQQCGIVGEECDQRKRSYAWMTTNRRFL